MFCYQCEQTAGCSGCTGKAGVCGKKEDTARLQDQLTGALIGLARSTDGNEWALKDSTAAIVVEGLFATLTNVNFDNEALQRLIDRVEEEKARIALSVHPPAAKTTTTIWKSSGLRTRISVPSNP